MFFGKTKKTKIPLIQEEEAVDISASKSVPTIDTSGVIDRSVTNSPLTDKDDVFDVESAADGAPEATIIEEKRSTNWSLTREVGGAVKEWVDETVEELKDDGPDVAPAATREKVIKKAGEKSHVAPGDDRKVVIQKLRTFAGDAERITGKSFKLDTTNAVAEEAPRWRQIGEDDNEEPSSAPRSLEALRRSAAPSQRAPEHTRADVIAKDTARAVSPEAVQALPESAFVRREELAVAETQAPAPEPQPEPAEETSRWTDRSEKFNLPVFGKRKESETVRTYRSDALENVTDRKLSVSAIAAAEAKRRHAREQTERDIPREASLSIAPIIGGMAVLAIIIGGVGGVWYFRSLEPEVTVVNGIRVPTLVKTAAQVPVPLSLSRTDFLNTLDTTRMNVSEREGFIQLYPTIETTGGTVPASTAVIFEVLQPQAPGSFIRTLGEDMVIGVYNSGERTPFIILKTEQFDDAFAGMLAWERYMSDDLAPFFGDPVRRTLSPHARGNDTEVAHFVDSAIRNRDVRILYDEAGNERIIYSFIDRNTVVITASRNAFTAFTETL